MPADFYIDVNATGNNSGLSWSDAYPAFGSGTYSAGNLIYVADTHYEFQNSDRIYDFVSNSIINPVRMISMTPSGDTEGIYNPGVTFAVSGGDIRLDDCYVLQGIHLDSAGQIHFNTNANDRTARLIDCQLRANQYQTSNGSWQSYIFENCNFIFKNPPNNPILFTSETIWEFYNCTFSGTHADGFFTNADRTLVLFDSCDLTDNPNIMDSDGSLSRTRIRRCKLLPSFVPGNMSTYSRMVFESCSSGIITTAPHTLTRVQDYSGNITTNESIYRSNGANDGLRANPYSWRVQTNSNTKKNVFGLTSEPVVAWVTGSGDGGSVPQTVSIFFATSGVTLYQEDVWFELESPNEMAPGSQTAVGKRNISKPNIHVTGLSLATDGNTWIGGGLDTFYRIDTEISPIESGPIYGTLHLARPSTTVFLDPKLKVSG